MKSMRYLNTILTILSLLLALQLWTSWTSETPAAVRFVSEAHAQGMPNAAAQRKQMIDLLREQNVKMDELKALLESGKARVRVEAGE